MENSRNSEVLVEGEYSKEKAPENDMIEKDSLTDTAERSEGKKSIIFKETPYRWYVVISFFLLTFANGLQWVTFSSCSKNFGEAYGMESWEVNMFSLIYMIIYPFVCIPEGHLVDAYSTRLGLILGALFTLLGGGLKCLVNYSMWFAFLGQISAGLFQPALLNSPGKIAANWFGENSRTVICTICCISDMIGILVGYVFHIPFIDNDSTGEKYKSQFYNYIFWEFILNIGFCLPTFFIIKDKPDIPPSPTQIEQDKPGLRESLKLLFTNKRFIYLLISSLFIVGYYDIYSTIINNYLAEYRISDNESSYIYFVSSIVGIIVSVVLSFLVDKYKKFKLFMVILVFFGIVFQSLFTILLELSLTKPINPFLIGMVMYTLISAVVIPFFTIGMNYACEITYPVGESINGGIMMTMSQLSGISGTFGCDALIKNENYPKYLTNVILLGFFVITAVFVCLFDDHLKRNEIDQKGLQQPKGETFKEAALEEENEDK